MSAKDMAKHKKVWAWKMLILGIIVLLNAAYAFIRWDYFIGILLVIAGLAKMLLPCHK